MDALFFMGQFFSFLSAICVCISTFSKKKKGLVTWQILDSSMVCLSDIFLMSWAAAAVSILSVIRNVLQVKNKMNLKITILLLVLIVGLGLAFNNRGWIGLLAIAASATYTFFMYKTKNAQQMRWALLLNTFLWLIHDIMIQSYPMIVMGIIIFVMTSFNLARLRKTPNKK